MTAIDDRRLAARAALRLRLSRLRRGESADLLIVGMQLGRRPAYVVEPIELGRYLRLGARCMLLGSSASRLHRQLGRMWLCLDHEPLYTILIFDGRHIVVPYSLLAKGGSS